MSKTLLPAICVVFTLAATVHAQTYKVLHSFGSSPGDPACPLPAGTISQSPGGNLYTALDDCFIDGGSAVRISVNGAVTVVHSFSGVDGVGPTGGLTFATDQRFHGTTEGGGLYGQGTIFRMAPDGKTTVLYNFHGDADGGHPHSAPIQSVSGNFYGITSTKYAINWGAIYKITTQGDFTVLHAFNGKDGAFAYGPIMQGADYGFYGVAGAGGKYRAGILFRISSQGYFKVLHDFDITHGEHPIGRLIQANDGNFYGTTADGGAGGVGVVYRLTPNLTYTVLHDFSGDSDGANPFGGLVEASDGNFYGTNIKGGANSNGVVFRITPTGAFTVLHDFDQSIHSSAWTTLVQHTNGFLYGTTHYGGTAGHGVFYRVDAGLPPFVSFLTVYGRVGAHVDILGQHFTDDSVVSFNGVPAENPEIHPTYIKAIVPDGATTGLITVTTTSGTLMSNKVFVVH